MKALNLVVLVPLLGSLAACSSWERKENYLAAKETKTLEIPRGLDSPNTQAQLVIPPTQANAAAASVKPPALDASAATLVDASRVIERDGIWQLDLTDAPEAAFPALATALERGGYPILSKDNAAFTYKIRSQKTGMPVEGGAVRRFFKRVTFSDAGKPVNVVLSANSAGGSVLEVKPVKGDQLYPDLARTLLAQLAERLK